MAVNDKRFRLATLLVIAVCIALKVESSIQQWTTRPTTRYPYTNAPTHNPYVTTTDPDRKGDDWGYKMTEDFNKLIRKADNLTLEGHRRLRSQTANPYEQLLNEQLRYLEHLSKRAKEFRNPDNNYLSNPFMKKLAEYTKNDLEFMAIFFSKVIEMFDTGNDRSFPILSAMVDEMVELAGKDVSYMKSNFTADAQKIETAAKKLETQFNDLNKISTMADLQKAIQTLVQSMASFQSQLLDAENKTNINRVPQ